MSSDCRIDLHQHPGQLRSRADAQLAVAAGEVNLDGLLGHEEGLCDFPIGQPVTCQPGDPQFAGGQ